MRTAIMLLILSSVLTNTYSQVEIIAHRGASYLAPENTVASSKLAWELGSDAVEVDIYLSGDNRIMCIHDANTRRTTGKDHIVKETGSEILRKLDAGSFKDPEYKDEKIPFLEEIIEAVPDGKELVIEIKCGSEVLPYLKSTIEKTTRKIKFVFIAFDFQTIISTKKSFPQNSCYWLCSNAELLNKNLHLVPDSGLDGVSLNYALINDAVASEVKKLNLSLYAWTVDNPVEARRLISLGVKGITTNRPGWLNDQIF